MPKRQKKYIAEGRPPLPLSERMSTPVRALVTKAVAEALAADAEHSGIAKPRYGLVASDIVRLYLHYGLEHRHLLTPELEADPSWDNLKKLGLL